MNLTLITFFNSKFYYCFFFLAVLFLSLSIRFYFIIKKEEDRIYFENNKKENARHFYKIEVLRKFIDPSEISFDDYLKKRLYMGFPLSAFVINWEKIK